jgi:hypothetical protein
MPMPSNKTKSYSADDGCTYLYDLIKQCWFKVCKVDAVPQSVIDQVVNGRGEAEAVLKSLEGLRGAG